MSPFHVRNGTPNFAREASRCGGAPVVVFLGGSITKADGYRVRTVENLRDFFGNERVRGINAGIGGTPSTYGAYRMERDVLVHSPHLILVEFAVNDYPLSKRETMRAMEGIVRQAWNADSRIDICFLYAMARPSFEDVAAGRVPPPIMAMEQVAEYYGIPSVNMAHTCCELLRQDRMVLIGDRSEDKQGRAVFSSDGTHPLLETGHALYAEAVADALPVLNAESADLPHKLPDPLDERHLGEARIMPVRPEMLSGAWEPADEQMVPAAGAFKREMPGLMGGSPGCELSFRFRGTSCGITDLMGPDSPDLEIRIDDEKPFRLSRFDHYCYYHRLSVANLIEDRQNAEYCVNVKVLPSGARKQALLAEHDRPHVDPSLLQSNIWYISGIAVDGAISDADHVST